MKGVSPGGGGRLLLQIKFSLVGWGQKWSMVMCCNKKKDLLFLWRPLGADQVVAAAANNWSTGNQPQHKLFPSYYTNSTSKLLRQQPISDDM